VQVADLSGADAAEVLLLREGAAQWVDELKVIGVQLFRAFNITGDERTKSLALS
jgi:hypothetical protein